MIRKTIIITGASGGIGGATAKLLAEKGYNIALCYCNNSTESLEEEIKKLKVDCKSYKIDIKNEKEVVEGFNKIFSDFDCVEGLVACAGIAEKEDLLINKNGKEIKNLIDTNVYGTILCNREACKHFISKKGSIVNVSSILGKVGCSCEVSYSASKAAIIGLTKALSKEMGEFGVRVNAVAPGMIKTNMTAVFTDEECKELAKNTSLGRIGAPIDVAKVIAFLISDESGFITGECIEVSGGLLI